MRIGNKVEFSIWGKKYFGTILWLKDLSAFILDENNKKWEINLSELKLV
jgi:hypothetical protein